MARPKTRRDVGFVSPSNVPGIIVNDLVHWSPPRGIDRLSPVDRIPPEFAYDLTNFLVEDGVLKSRRPFKRLDVGLGQTDVVGIATFVTSDGLLHLVRFRTTTVQYWDGSAWQTPTGAPTLTGTVDDYFAVTAFGNRMVFSNGVNGIYEWDFTTQTVTTLTTTYAAKQLTTFIGRIMGSDVRDNGGPNDFPHQVRWSVKNNSADWTGIGSGYEDFLSTPGGYVDRQMGIVPVNDSLALVFRENSTWLMAETGNAEAPVRVSRLFAELGTQAPRSLKAVPGGAVGLFNDDVYVVSESELISIGRPIWPILQLAEEDLGRVVGGYNHRRREFALAVPVDGVFQLLRYSFRDKAWSRHPVPWPIRDIAYSSSPFRGLTIGTSPGTFGAATGTIGSEVGSEGGDELRLLATWSDGKHNVFQEDTVIGSDEGDITYWKATTGIIRGANPLQETYLIEVQIKYETTRHVIGKLSLSRDKFETIETYSNPVIFPVTKRPSIVRLTKQVVGNDIQLELSVPPAAQIPGFEVPENDFRIISFTARVVEGGLERP